MNLHQNEEDFIGIIEEINVQTGCRKDVLEKDYYVVLFLKELSEKQEKGLPAYFKGGTALYKALKSINRFSEDIDLSVDTRECSRSQNDKRLEDATKKYSSLIRDSSLGRTNRSEIISVYKYNPVSNYDESDTLQRFSQVKIEATSFTISEPVVSMEVTPLLYDLSTPSQRDVLESKYNVKPFSVLTISMERIFIDKLFAAESYFRRSANEANAFDATKHMYDLAVMMNQPKIINLISNEYAMKKLLDIRTKEEMSRLDGIPGVAPNEFKFFRYATESPTIHYQYERMQNIYVLNPNEKINYDSLCSSIKKLEAMLNINYSWKNYIIEKHKIEIEKSNVRDDFER